MNTTKIQSESQEPSFVPAKNPREERSPGRRMEPWEFERLLERAMEVLSARAQEAVASGTGT